MKYTGSGLALTESFEGIRLAAYPDPASGGDPWTIGYGHTKGVKRGDICTPAQAVAWLIEDAQWAQDEVNQLVTHDIDQDENNSLVDFVFNLGAGKFASSTLLKDINAGNFEAAANEFEKWDMAAGKVMAGLLRRRLAEKALFEKGMSEAGSATIAPNTANTVVATPATPVSATPTPSVMNVFEDSFMKALRVS